MSVNKFFSTSFFPQISILGTSFRPFFLFGAIYSVLLVGVWLLTIHGVLSKGLYGGDYFWHTHEMLFGFVAAIIVGFLLTALQNWTGIRGINGWTLGLLFLTWLVSRIGFLIIEEVNIWMAVIDISFLIMAAVLLAIPVIKVKQWRNLFFVPILITFCICNTMMHVGVINQNHTLITQAVQSSLLLVTLLMSVIGGRVIPFFTANGTKTPRVTNVQIIEYLSLGSVLLLMLIFLLSINKLLPDKAIAALFTFAAISQLIRWFRWRFWITFKVPLLWSLHVAYLFIIIAFFVISMNFWGIDILLSIGWHLLTIGGIGALILSMIARVSLGHTGRKLIAPRWMFPAFIFIFISAITRTLLVIILPTYYLFFITISGISWILAFIIFVIGYFNILTQPRIDKKPG
jgi:uncharacterized protein involved in response to NO